MIYCCEDCGFLFRRIGEVTACPFCESKRFRTATEAEAKRLQAIINNDTDMSTSPHGKRSMLKTS